MDQAINPECLKMAHQNMRMRSAIEFFLQAWNRALKERGDVTSEQVILEITNLRQALEGVKRGD